MTHSYEDHRADTPTAPAPPGELGLPLVLLALLALLIGYIVGASTSLLQGRTDGATASLFDAISPWLAPAFAVGAFARRPWHAALVGVVVCLVELAAYDVTAAGRGFPQGTDITMFWAYSGVIGGLLFGWAGHHWWNVTGPLRGLGVALMSGAFIAEGGYYALELHYRASAHLFVAIGVILFAVLGLRRQQHVRAAGWLLVVLPLGALGEVLTNSLIVNFV